MLPVRFLGRSGVNGEQLTECKVRDIELVGSWLSGGDEVSENSGINIFSSRLESGSLGRSMTHRLIQLKVL